MDEIIALNLQSSESASAAEQQAATEAKQKFVSTFQVNGTPILPPLMTKEKQIEMSELREKAIAVEQRLEQQRQSAHALCATVEAEPIAEPTEQPGDIMADEKPKAEEEDEANSQTNSNCVAAGDGNNNNLLVVEQKSNVVEADVACTITKVQKSQLAKELELVYEKRMANQNWRITQLSQSETIVFDSTVTESPILTATEPAAEAEQSPSKLTLATSDVTAHTENSLPIIEAESTDSSAVTTPTKPSTLNLQLCANAVPLIRVNPPTPSTPNESALSSVTSNISIVINEVHELASPTSSEDSSKTVAKSPRKRKPLIARINHFEQNKPAAAYSSLHSCNLSTPTTMLSRTPKRSATVHSIKSIVDKAFDQAADLDFTAASGSLIRSNSFTLDKPSKVLLEHMQKQDTSAAARKPNHSLIRERAQSTNRPSSTRDTVESRAKRVQKVETKSRSSSEVSRNAVWRYATRDTTDSAKSSKRSPYDSAKKTGTKPKLKNAASPTATIVKPTATIVSPPKEIDEPTVKVQSAIPQSLNNNLPEMSGSTLNIFNQLQGEHRDRFLSLYVQKQQDAQRIRQEFEAECEKLLTEVDVLSSTASSSSASASPPSPPPPPVPPLPLSAALYESPVRTNPLNDATTTAGSVTNSPTNRTAGNDKQGASRRRLFNETDGQASNNNNNNNKSSSTKSRRPYVDESRRIAAATIINSYARGYLVRRLFQTEQIQRIVQTIRDTLIFVLNLHLESFENPAEANTATNIKLKARLLQQLSSASRTLYLVFFQTSIPERMDIIARDRKRLKTKVIAANLRRSRH